MNIKKFTLFASLLFGFFSANLHADDAIKNNVDELKIKREQEFEFVAKPSVLRQGDRIEISFETKSFCDATVVVENQEGKIIRHLASGVLGPNSPLPFQKNSKKQTIVWDSKDDQEVYVENKNDHIIRVSLGLKPQFERNVLWAPHRRISAKRAVLASCSEGILVCEGQGVDHLRLFDHSGDYIKTIYPFSSEKVSQVKGLLVHEFPQDGQKLPIKQGHVQSTLLTSGTSCSSTDIFGTGRAADVMAAHKNTILIAQNKLNWLGLDGTSNGREILGVDISQEVSLHTIHEFRGGNYKIGPKSMAFSPDGKWVYMTCYFWDFSWHQGALHAVTRMATDKNEAPVLWKGSLKQSKYNCPPEERQTGEAPADFIQPMSVACDSEGKVYVADYFNDRIQVFNEDGSFVASIKANKPTKVCVHPKTGEIFVFSWAVSGIEWHNAIKKNPECVFVPATLTRFKSVKKPEQISQFELPLYWGNNDNVYRYKNQKGGTDHMPDGWWNAAEIDFNAPEPTIWLIPASLAMGGEKAAPKLYTMKEDKLVLLRDTGVEVKNKIPILQPAPFARQRMCVNKANGLLYLYEQDNGTDKNFRRVTEFNPENGAAKLIELPCHAEDMCFDLNGFVYLRVDQGVIRYNSTTWKEVPWDYGEESQGVMFSGTSGGRSVQSDSVLRVPGGRTSPFWHLSGMEISPRGHLAVSTFNSDRKSERNDGVLAPKISTVAKKYAPLNYPGRFQWGEIHIFDKHGKVVLQDALPGVGHMDGIGIDKDDNIYVMVGSTRLIDGKKYDNQPSDVTETILKVQAGRGKVISASKSISVVLPDSEQPKRPADVSGGLGTGGNAWVENAEWFYGGVGSCFTNQPAPSCCCWNSRFSIDLLGRSFAPEIRHSSVAVLDTAGNLILRIGRYGNVDDGKPTILDPENKNPRSIGGDEVSLFYAPFVTSHTDKRVFIADPGNGRIVSVKLNYHTDEKVLLNTVKEK